MFLILIMTDEIRKAHSCMVGGGGQSQMLQTLYSAGKRSIPRNEYRTFFKKFGCEGKREAMAKQ